MAIGDPVFHQLGDLVGGVCFVGVQPVAGGGGHDIEPGQVQTGNPEGMLPLAEFFDRC